MHAWWNPFHWQIARERTNSNSVLSPHTIVPPYLDNPARLLHCHSPSRSHTCNTEGCTCRHCTGTGCWYKCSSTHRWRHARSLRNRRCTPCSHVLPRRHALWVTNGTTNHRKPKEMKRIKREKKTQNDITILVTNTMYMHYACVSNGADCNLTDFHSSLQISAFTTGCF